MILCSKLVPAQHAVPSLDAVPHQLSPSHFIMILSTVYIRLSVHKSSDDVCTIRQIRQPHSVRSARLQKTMSRPHKVVDDHSIFMPI